MHTFVLRLRRYIRSARRHWRLILVWAFSAGMLFTGVLFLWAATLELPDLSALETRRVEQSVKIYDRTGEVLLYDLHDKMQRTVLPLSGISPLISQAIIAIEDPEFYTHAGVKPTAILRAVLTNAAQGDLLSGQGGSTITQQVVKLTVLTADKTITRKLKEWILALKMTRALTKDQVLEIYLNQVPFGGQLYGVEEAALTFFGKHAGDISLPEAAYLAAVLPAPTRLSPYGTHQDQLESRKNLVLDKMFEHGYITSLERDEAKRAKVIFKPPRDTSIAAPHFVFYVRQYLEDKYGEEAVQSGGWRVTTTLDADLQTHAEEIVNRNALANVAKFNATNMALTAVDPKTGQILVMVGSRNYFDTDIPGAYNVATAKPGRQPGSAFKPFAYAQAFSEGYTPDTVVFDVRTQFSTACKPSDITNSTPPCYSPVNYDGLFRGPMSLRNALAQSINVPAIKVLYLAGINDTLKIAKSMGISTLTNADQYGLTLVLGGGEVTPLEMTDAYATFANDGMHYDTTPILRIEDPQGNVVEDNTERAGNQVVAPDVAQKINDVLSDPVARAPLGENTLFNFPGHDVAVKTGTTNDYRDAWTIGYTPNIAVGIWAGNNDNTSMVKKVSGFIVGPAWSEFMRYALTKTTPQAFTRAEYAPAQKAILNGSWQIPGADGLVHEILYWVSKNNPTGPAPSNPAADSQYERWDAPVRAQYGGAGVQQQPVQNQYIFTPAPQTQYQYPNGNSIIPQVPVQ
ncbi:penicillin-binding protein [Candidatus Kaiserbacteria bacterium]|nr:penicillin-binding protein [Candidatus Kaiserbacteria bacterium]